ncbi:LysR family transcriptional regulator [Rhizobium sp. SYY.PMSO]|uniref:LysR family transcriptional regulator n=1 Tax=Rhizobium sp. SYY.PMSO TaxID=3382192 RepID=UPI0039902B3C
MPKIDYPHLAAFVVSCDSPSMAYAADKLGLLPSTLSTRLSTLEAQIGVTLFGRKDRSSYPLRSAAWLYNRSVRLLLAEEYLRLASQNNGSAPPKCIILHIDVDYIWTAISYAIIAAIRSFHSKPGRPYVDLIFTGARAFGAQKAPVPLLSDTSTVGKLEIHHSAGEPASASATIIVSDHWVRLIHAGGAFSRQDEMALEIAIPDLPGTLQSDTKFSASNRMATSRISATDRSLQDLAGLLDDLQKADLLLPRLIVPPRLSGQGTNMVPVAQGPACNVIADISGEHEFLANLLDEIRNRGDGALPFAGATDFRPEIGLKQIATVNRVMQTGSMASAARVTGRTAAIIPAQLEQIERVLGSKLIERRKSGSEPTDCARQLHPLFLGIERSFKDAFGERSHIAAVFEQSIRVALPVSWSADSLTSECMAAALSAFHAEYPNCRIEVVEGPRHVLHRGVQTGQFNIAIVGRIDPQVGSLPIGRSEDVVLIVNKKAHFRPKTDRVTADELRNVPLILAPTQLTMHQTLLTALAKSTVQLEPVMRLGSVPLIVSVLRRSPLGTILPASVMIKEIQAGIVEVFPLDHLVPPRRLWAIFSTSDTLNDTERALIGHIKEAFQRALGSIAFPRNFELQ